MPMKIALLVASSSTIAMSVMADRLMGEGKQKNKTHLKYLDPLLFHSLCSVSEAVEIYVNG